MLTQFGFGFIQRTKDEANLRFTELVDSNKKDDQRKEKKREKKKHNKKEKHRKVAYEEDELEDEYIGPKIPENFTEKE